MRIQRYAYTALIAALLWPVLLHFFDPPMFEVIATDLLIAVYLTAGIIVGTILGIWTMDAMVEWSSGGAPLIGLKAALIRAGIGVIAASLFSIWFWKLLDGFGVPIPFFEIVKTRAITVVAAVWLAAQIVDFLKRAPAPSRRR